MEPGTLLVSASLFRMSHVLLKGNASYKLIICVIKDINVVIHSRVQVISKHSRGGLYFSFGLHIYVQAFVSEK